MQNLQSAFGIFALLALAWIVSEDRRGEQFYTQPRQRDRR